MLRLIEENNQRSGLEIVLDDVIKIVNFNCSNSVKHRLFSEPRKDMEADAMRLHHAEVQCLSRGTFLKQVFQLQQELQVFLVQQEHPMSNNFQDNFWFVKLSYFSAVFQNTNRLNVSLQG